MKDESIIVVPSVLEDHYSNGTFGTKTAGGMKKKITDKRVKKKMNSNYINLKNLLADDPKIYNGRI